MLRAFDDRFDIFLAGGDGGDFDKICIEFACENASEGGLAGTWWSPENEVDWFTFFDDFGQNFAITNNLVLAIDVFKFGGAHTFCEWNSVHIYYYITFCSFDADELWGNMNIITPKSSQNKIFYGKMELTLIKRSYLMYTYTYDDPMLISTNTVSSGNPAAIWTIIAAVLALVGGILTYFLFVKSKTEPKGRFVKWLKDFLSFKTMWIEPLMKIVYYVLTIFVVLGAFAYIATDAITFFAMLIGGPIVVRLSYELVMMFIMIWRNTQTIADNTKRQ